MTNEKKIIIIDIMYLNELVFIFSINSFLSIIKKFMILDKDLH